MIKKKHLNNVYAKYKYQKINKIQTMLKHFSNKKNFIKQKIFEIYKFKINEIHTLFILSEEEQNINTIEFLNKFQLPFIHFNNENNYFKNKNHENIKEFNLDEYIHFIKNNN